MHPVEGSFVVHDDGDALEVVARAAGPAGSVGVELFDGAVSLDLDGADVDQLVSVRLRLDDRAAGLAAEQVFFVEEFFGGLAPSVLGALGSPRPVRVGERRRSLSSLRGVVVDPATALLVVSVDALVRAPLPERSAAVLALVALVGAGESGLGVPAGLRSWLEGRLVGLPQEFPSPGLEDEFRRVLERAIRQGVLILPPTPAADPAVTVSSVWREASGGMLLPSGVLSRSIPLPVAPPQVVLDPGSLVVSGVVWSWAAEGSVEVRVHLDAADEELWARLRSKDGEILAASPLGVPDDGVRSALLLVAPQDGLVLDVVSSVRAPVPPAPVVAVSRAAEAGRRAGRLERLGADAAAAVAWEECASWHRVAGDAPREKLALGRVGGFSSGSVDGMSVVDAVLSGPPSP